MIGSIYYTNRLKNKIFWTNVNILNHHGVCVPDAVQLKMSSIDNFHLECPLQV